VVGKLVRVDIFRFISRPSIVLPSSTEEVVMKTKVAGISSAYTRSFIQRSYMYVVLLLLDIPLIHRIGCLPHSSCIRKTPRTYTLDFQVFAFFNGLLLILSILSEPFLWTLKTLETLTFPMFLYILPHAQYEQFTAVSGSQNAISCA